LALFPWAWQGQRQRHGVLHLRLDFTYDSAGQRVRKVYEHSGLIEERIYLGGFEIYRKRVASTNELTLERETLHVMDGVRRIALVETKTVDTDIPSFTPVTVTRVQLGNHLGSAALEVTLAGAVISYEEYHPYGTTAYQSASSAVEVSRKRYRYTGKERDEETGLYYHGARYYAPWLGRWTAADPAGIKGGINNYGYCHENPIILMDSDGKDPAPLLVPPELPAIPAPGGAANGFFELAGAAANDNAVAAAGVGLGAAEGPALGAAAAGAGWLAALGGALAGTGIIHTTRAVSIGQYGNPFGQSHQDAAFGILKHLPAHTPATPPAPRSTPAPPPPVLPAVGIVVFAGAWYLRDQLFDNDAHASGAPPTGGPPKPSSGAPKAVALPHSKKEEQDKSKVTAPGPKTVKVYRVEGDPNSRILITDSGDIVIKGKQMLFLNFGNPKRAEMYLKMKLKDKLPGATVKSFEVSQEFLDELRRTAVPESLKKQFPHAPLEVDRKFDDQYGLRPSHVDHLKKHIVPGSGQPKPKGSP